MDVEMELSIFSNISSLRTGSKVGVMIRSDASIIAKARKKPLKDFEKPLIMPSISPSARITKNAISAYGTSAARMYVMLLLCLIRVRVYSLWYTIL